MAAQIVPANAAQAKALEKSAQALEAFAQQIGPKLAYRWATWEHLRNMAASYDIDVREIVGDDVAALNDAADKTTRAWIRTVGNMALGSAELVGRQDKGQLKLGVLPRGVARSGSLGFPLVPVIVVGGIATAAWLAWDAWMQAREAEAAAQLAQAANDAKKLELVSKAQAMGGNALKQLTDAFAAADLKGQNASSSWLDWAVKLVQRFGDIVGASIAKAGGTALGGGVVVLILLWLWSRRNKHA